MGRGALPLMPARRKAAASAPRLPDSTEAQRQRKLAAAHDDDLAARMAGRAADDVVDLIMDDEDETPPAALDDEQSAATATPVPVPLPAMPDGDDKVVHENKVFTPEIARRDLENMGANRPVSDARVQQYAADMRAGAWRMSHQGLAYDQQGKLRDGQHRLWAVVEAGVPVWMHVARGLSEEACATIDQMRARTAADALRIGGLKPQAKAVSWFRVLASVRAKRPVMVSQAEARDQLARYAPTVTWLLEHAPKTRPLNRVPVIAAMLLAHAAAPEQTAAFVEGYATGAGLEPGSPILALRKYVLETVPHVRESEPKVFAKALRALYAHVEGEPIHELKESQAAWSWFDARQPRDGAP